MFPEKCDYQFGVAPRSGIYKIESVENGRSLSVSQNWVSLENQAFYSQYQVVPDGERRIFDNQELADELLGDIPNSATLRILFYKSGEQTLEVIKEILPNGYLRITQKSTRPDGTPFTNIDVYHKQMSVLPYASSVGSVAIKPTEEGVIKHKALQAMEEQTNMQLSQIREQIELLARQAQEISKRRELSMMIYEAKLNFQPVIGHTYFLYEKKDGQHILSLISPREWGGSGPHKQFISAVRLLADHTWVEVDF